MASYFASLGYPCPNQVSPAEFYVDLISVDYSSPEKEEESKHRIQELGDALRATQLKDGYSQDDMSISNNGNYRSVGTLKRGLGGMLKTALTKFVLLYRRAWRSVSRDKSLNIARFMSSLFSALLFGAIYFRMGNGSSTVPDRLGLLQVAAVNTAMTSLIKVCMK
jgi:hypothetical protein